MFDVLKIIGDSKVIAILRGVPPQYLDDTLDALIAGGIRCVEITMDSPGALDMIRQAKATYGSQLLVGAGTVLDAETARLAILAGADFCLSPTVDVQMIELCNRYGVLAVPGIFTPTEAITAWNAGAQLLKVYPATIGGPGYIKDLLGPLSQLRLLPVGGVNKDNARAYINAGAFAVGVGSNLVNATEVKAGNFAQITSEADALMKGTSA